METLNQKYAEALFRLAKKQDQVRKIREELSEADKIFSSMRVSVKLGVQDEEESSRKVQAEVDGRNLFLKDERISSDVKKDIARTLLEDKVGSAVLQFVYILIDKNRISSFHQIQKEYRKIANKDLGIREGRLESARELDKDQVKKLAEVLSKNGKEVELNTHIDESLISGFRVVFDDEVIDRSTKEEIRKIRVEWNGKVDVPWI